MNQYIIYALIALGLFTAGGATGWHEKALRVPALLEEQKTADNKQCETDKQTTKEATDALQKNRDDLAQRLGALKLQHPATCVAVTGAPDLQHRGNRSAGHNGLSSDWLYTFAADQCSNYWRQLKVCDKFLDDERKQP